MCPKPTLVNPPLVSLAGLDKAWVTEAALAKNKLVVFEAHTSSHTGTRICSAIRGTHRDEAVRTATRKTLQGKARRKQCRVNVWYNVQLLMFNISQFGGLTGKVSVLIVRVSVVGTLSGGADGLSGEAGTGVTVDLKR